MGWKMEKNVDFVVNETRDIPPEERTIIDQIREIIAESLGSNHGYSFKHHAECLDIMNNS